MRLEEITLLESWYQGEFYTEVFKDLPGYEGIFKVSSFGRVWSCERPNKQGRICGGMLLSVLKMKSGYCRVQLTSNGIKLKKVVHILVCLTFHPNRESKPMVNHKDFNKSNNFYLNLEWTTAMENSLHYFQSISKTGRAGIHFHNKRQRFQGLILFKGKRHRIGDHRTFEQANEAYNKKLESLGIPNYYVEGTNLRC